MIPKKGDYFRVLGPKGVGPEVWTWDGQCIEEQGKKLYLCRRLIDGFTVTLLTKQMVKIPDLKEL